MINSQSSTALVVRPWVLGIGANSDATRCTSNSAPLGPIQTYSKFNFIMVDKCRVLKVKTQYKLHKLIYEPFTRIFWASDFCRLNDTIAWLGVLCKLGVAASNISNKTAAGCVLETAFNSMQWHVLFKTLGQMTNHDFTQIHRRFPSLKKSQANHEPIWLHQWFTGPWRTISTPIFTMVR